MANALALNEMRSRLRKETEDVVKEVGELVDEVSKDYAILSNLPEAEAVAAVTDVYTSIALEYIKLPWYTPEWLVRKALASAVEKLVKAKRAGA